MKSQQARLALIGIALGVLLALVLAPPSRWLVRLQMLTVLRLYHPFPSIAPPSYTLSQADDDRHIRAVTALHPDDFGLHYAAADSGDSAQAVVSLRALETRFPDQPALYAGILRYASSGLHWNRMEENALYGLPRHPKEFHPVPNSPQVLAAFDADAAAGERLDPNNAYFPIMRAIGLFAARRDIEGLAAVGRAGRETAWREYVPQEVEARWRLHEAAFGDPGALPRAVFASSILFPQYAKLRALARLLLAKAVEEEQAGHPEEGLKLREELNHYGDLMRVQSSSAISSLVGIAISSIATGHPGGVMPPKDGPVLTPEQNTQRRLDAYSAYVTRLGHPEAAARARAEQAAGQQVSALVRLEDFSRFLSPLTHLGQWWLADLAVLSNLFWLLLLGGLTAALARTRWAQESRAGEKAAVSRRAFFRQSLVATGIVAVVFLLADRFLYLFSLPSSLGHILRDVETLLLILVVFGLPSAFAVYLLRHGFHSVRFSRPDLLRKVGGVFLAAVFCYSLYALVQWQAHSLNDLLTALISLTTSSDDNEDTRQLSERLQFALSAALVVAVPILLLLVSGIAARIRRVPVFVGTVQSFRAAALPAACLLLLVWGGLLLGTVRQEGVVNAQVEHQVHDEGPYLAAQVGTSWPGPVR